MSTTWRKYHQSKNEQICQKRVKLTDTFTNDNDLAKIPPTQKRGDMLKKTQKTYYGKIIL